jgi:signal peptidase I
MSAPPSSNGERPAVVTDTYPDLPAVPSASSTDAGPGRHARDASAWRAAAIRSAQELDYRLRGLSIDPTGYVPTAPTRPDRRRRRPRRLGRLLAKVAVPFVVAALAAWLLQAFVAEPYSVPGTAMAPSLEPCDRILVVKSGLFENPIRAGQVVVVRPPRFLPCTIGGEGGDLVLRVVALPGQTIWSVGSIIFVDGQPLREPGWYSPRSGPVGSMPIPSTTLARGQYFVLSDNRSNACDSRAFGPVPGPSIVGEAMAIVERNGHVFLRTL